MRLESGYDHHKVAKNETRCIPIKCTGTVVPHGYDLELNMSSPNKTSLYLNVSLGNGKEPPISNDLFLESFGHYTLWMRALHAMRMLEGWSKDDNGSLNDLVVTVSVYEQLGMFFEDIVCTLAAWGAWKRNPALLLGDLLDRIVTSPNETGWDPKAGNYHDKVFDQLSRGNRKERIDPYLLITSLKALDPDEFLSQIGVPWKKFPSVKLVEKRKESDWQKLPQVASGLFSVIDDPNMSLLSRGYNKLKHGPQMAIMNLEECLRRRGMTDRIDDLGIRAYDRLLFSGSRTQEVPGEYENNKRVAPYLISDFQVLKKMVFSTMFVAAIQMFQFSTWLFKCHFERHLTLPKDPSWEKMHTEFGGFIAAQQGGVKVTVQ